MASFAVAPAAVIDGEPERAQEVVFVGDSPRRHHDGRDRVVDDFLLCAWGDAARLVAAPELSDQRCAL